jgi:hypothetical protein
MFCFPIDLMCYLVFSEPCPSQVFQSLLAKMLLDNEALSTRFLDTLMNQLNWSFSEFVGMMQEVGRLFLEKYFCNKLHQKSMRNRSMRLTLSRVRHVTFIQDARAMLNLPCLQHSLQAALIFTQESWVRNSLSVSIWFDALAVISINPIRHRIGQALS